MKGKCYPLMILPATFDLSTTPAASLFV